MDVYGTVPVLESAEGLHGFWQSGVNHQRVSNPFELIDVVLAFIEEELG